MFKQNCNFVPWQQKVLSDQEIQDPHTFPNSSTTILLKPPPNITWIFAATSSLVFL
jgi:hypothetical protein